MENITYEDDYDIRIYQKICEDGRILRDSEILDLLNTQNDLIEKLKKFIPEDIELDEYLNEKE